MMLAGALTQILQQLQRCAHIVGRPWTLPIVACCLQRLRVGGGRGVGMWGLYIVLAPGISHC